jgi:DNA mismatch repair ATPase MutS
MLKDIKGNFNSRIVDFEILKKKYTSRSNMLSTIRVLLFVLTIIFIVYYANDRNGEAVFFSFLGFVILFGLIVNYHNKQKNKRILYQNLVIINQEEVLRLEGNLRGFDKGERFAYSLHPYCNDLDIFGENSIFQLINRTSTEGSREKLSGWLKFLPNKEEILRRQQTVHELSQKLDWRQNFQASALHLSEDKGSLNSLITWINEENQIKHPGVFKLLSFLMPLAFFFLLYMYFVHNWSYYFFVGVMIINGLILRQIFDIAKSTTERTGEGIKSLKANYTLIGQIEKEDFQSLKAQSLKADFIDGQIKASNKINDLQNILEFLYARSNMFYGLINVIFLTDIHLISRAEKWKKQNKVYVERWFESLMEFDVLVSIAGFAYSNPKYTFPYIEDDEHVFKAEKMGHPLIKKNIRIYNNFELSGRNETALITGSNMAGKSTFLRTVGVNYVLGLIGAPVCAECLNISVRLVFTSMRTQDNLEESVSSFYAELQRLKQLLDILKEGTPVLFMLDEILKGTNSQDRHKGAKSLIKQLSKLNASGMVSTHDLELGQLTEFMDNVVNYSFNSEVKGDEIYFDYKLHPGICKSFNASKLMEKMGIEIEN